MDILGLIVPIGASITVIGIATFIIGVIWNIWVG